MTFRAILPLGRGDHSIVSIVGSGHVVVAVYWQPIHITLHHSTGPQHEQLVAAGDIMEFSTTATQDCTESSMFNLHHNSPAHDH